MLNLDLNRILEHRDIQNPRNFLVKAGFTYHAAGRLLKNQLPGTRYIEMLCIALNCTPDDLFNWTPGKEVKSPKKLALSKLAGRKSNGRITTKLMNLPEHKIEELHQFLNKLTSSE